MTGARGLQMRRNRGFHGSHLGLDVALMRSARSRVDLLKTVERQREMLDALRGLPVQQQARDVGPRIVPGRIGGVLGDPDRAEIDVGEQQPFLIGRQLLGDRTAVGPIDRGMSAADMQQRVLVVAVAHFVDHGLRDSGAGRQHEARALDRIDARGRVVDLPA
ncbi:hypothetical protein chiPu_0032227, partial [Chiloscyllium punctatum]|nr:hypothetical protein [Chiloscyllium punctatum]